MIRTMILLAVVFFFSVYPAFAQQAEQVTVTAYYPAPYGEYEQLRFVPQVTVPPCAAGTEGTMYYNSLENQLYYCDGNTWRVLAGGATEYWTQSGTNLYPAARQDGTHRLVGTGAAAPVYNLHVNGSTNATQLCIGKICKAGWGAPACKAGEAIQSIDIATGKATCVALETAAK